MGVLANSNDVSVFVHDVYGNFYMNHQFEIEDELFRDFIWDKTDETKYFVVGRSAYPKHCSM